MRSIYLWLLLVCLQLIDGRSLRRRDDDDGYDDDDENDEWPDMSSARAVAMRSQRDVSLKDTLNRQSLFGVDLQPVLFHLEGYTKDSMDDFRSLLNVGSQIVLFDIYYNEDTKYWQMCPVAIPLSDKMSDDPYFDSTFGVNCSSDFELPHLLNTINGFFLDTPTKYSVNLFYLMMRLHSIRSDYPSLSPSYDGNKLPLGKQLQNHIDKIMTPSDYDSSNLPTLSDFLLKDYLRLIPIVVENNLFDNTSYDIAKDEAYLYFKDSTIDIDMIPFGQLECTNDMNITSLESSIYNSTILFSYDTDKSKFTRDSFRDSISCGVSAIISHQLDSIDSISDFLPYSFWSWGPWDVNEIPSLIADNSTETTNSNMNQNTHDDDEVYRCAVIQVDTRGWTTSKYCSDLNRVACLNKNNATDWKLTDSEYSFFDAGNACKSDANIPSNFQFSIPPSPRSQAVLLSLMDNESTLKSNQSVWIDLNSLHTSNCWVVGGAKVTCPYEKVITTKMFKEMITPTSVIAFILLVIMICLHFVSFPVHQNRKYWRKAIAEHSKNDYEGVPA